ncbi:hypothetical protein [Achromobacter sp. KK8]|jgi:hypothetical protein
MQVDDAVERDAQDLAVEAHGAFEVGGGNFHVLDQIHGRTGKCVGAPR